MFNNKYLGVASDRQPLKIQTSKKKNLKTKTVAQITRAGAIIVKDNIQVQQTRFLKKKKKKRVRQTWTAKGKK